MDLICRRLDPKPRSLKCGKEEQNQDLSDRRAADQRIGHRSPEHGMREGDEGQPVSTTMAIVEKDRTCSMMTISMAAIMAGKIVANASLALVASSIDPPNSIR